MSTRTRGGMGAAAIADAGAVLRVEAARRLARAAGAMYVVNIASGSLGLALGRSGVGQWVGLVASASYAAVTVLFYLLFRPTSQRLSLTAAIVGLVGCGLSAAASLGVVRSPIHPLAIFGVYCVLVGALIVRSTLVPRAFGVMLAVGGLAWLTFGWPPLAHRLAPYNMAPGILAESALTMWLLVRGVRGSGGAVEGGAQGAAEG